MMVKYNFGELVKLEQSDSFVITRWWTLLCQLLCILKVRIHKTASARPVNNDQTNATIIKQFTKRVRRQDLLLFGWAVIVNSLGPTCVRHYSATQWSQEASGVSSCWTMAEDGRRNDPPGQILSQRQLAEPCAHRQPKMSTRRHQCQQAAKPCVAAAALASWMSHDCDNRLVWKWSCRICSCSCSFFF